MNFASRLVAMAATASLAFAPAVAQANTRAGDNATIYSSTALSQPGLGRNAEGLGLANDDDDDDDAGAIFTAIALILVTAGIIVLIDDDDDQSPGT